MSLFPARAVWFDSYAIFVGVEVEPFWAAKVTSSVGLPSTCDKEMYLKFLGLPFDDDLCPEMFFLVFVFVQVQLFQPISPKFSLTSCPPVSCPVHSIH